MTSMETVEVRLTNEERTLLLERCSLAEEWRALLADDSPGLSNVRLSRPQIDALREAVADRLQAAGFDEQWAVNPEGRVLEGIIDKLMLQGRK